MPFGTPSIELSQPSTEQGGGHLSPPESTDNSLESTSLQSGDRPEESLVPAQSPNSSKKSRGRTKKPCSTIVNPIEDEEGAKERGRPKESLQLKKAIDRGPYTSKHVKWNNVERFLRIKAEREMEGYPVIREADFKRWTDLSFDEVYRTERDPEFQLFRLARTKTSLVGAMSDVAPQLREALFHLSKNCRDDKARERFVELADKLMRSYGLDKVDITSASQGNDLDTDEAAQEAISICEELTGVKPILQKFLKRIIHGTGTTDADWDKPSETPSQPDRVPENNP